LAQPRKVSAIHLANERFLYTTTCQNVKSDPARLSPPGSWHRRASSQVIGYVRVSTDEQSSSGAGLEAQRRAIIAECERRGWQLVEVIEDAGWTPRRGRGGSRSGAPSA
jgi:hypothetical protein